MELLELRNQINEIDSQIVKLFVARMELAAKVAEYKKVNGLPILVPEREREILKDVGAKAGYEFGQYAQALYSTIFDLSKTYQIKCNTSKKDK